MVESPIDILGNLLKSEMLTMTKDTSSDSYSEHIGRDLSFR